MISPILGHNCRFFPTCSDYAIQSLREYGFLRAIPLIFRRIIKCNPLGPFGNDPVPIKRKKIAIYKKKTKIEEVSINTIRKIRKENLYKNLPLIYSQYDEDELNSTKHYGLKINNQIVSVITLIKNEFFLKPELESMQIRGMTTILNQRRKGFGKILLSEVINKIKNEKRYSIVWCNSRINSVKFYSNNSFTQVGEIFNIKKIGLHIKFYYDLKNDR